MTTGNEELDAALAGLDELRELPPAEQLARLTLAHEALHRALTTPAGNA